MNNVIPNDIRIEVLTQALPYIQRYRDKVIVINYSGRASASPEAVAGVVSDVVLLFLTGVKVVMVHGECGSVESLLELSAAVTKAGGKALALCDVDTGAINDALSLGYIPIVAALSSDENGTVEVINTDEAAARIAGELKAENMIALTNVRGILRDETDESTLISELSISDVPFLIKQSVITGGMVDKANACVEAIRRGVKKTFIIDGRVLHSILIEMFSDEGIGTMLV
ncbi:MAG: acetylglutamate kinase [Clostridiales bacterium]|jgi:acetylglutamate kinase|nr:acetylglutamate kinase [Clostridiales bacterium]